MPFARGGRPGLLGTMARTAVVAGTAQRTSNRVNRRERARMEQDAPVQDLPPAPPPPNPPPAAPASSGDQLTDQLARLAEMRSSGVLTDEEFAAAKSRLLA